jgi:hypothetical protein
MTAPFASWSSVIHSCRARTVYFDEPVTHVVTPTHGPRATRVSDFEDAGFDVVAYGVLPSEIDGCDETGIYGEHVLIRPNPPL